MQEPSASQCVCGCQCQNFKHDNHQSYCNCLDHITLIAMFQMCKQLTVSTLVYTRKSIVASDHNKHHLLEGCYLQGVILLDTVGEYLHAFQCWKHVLVDTINKIGDENIFGIQT